MAAYVISEVEMVEQESWDSYRELAAASIAEYGGRYLVRGATQEVVEGPSSSRHVVIVEFKDMRTLKEWYGSATYAKALAFRNRGLSRRLTFVEGV